MPRKMTLDDRKFKIKICMKCKSRNAWTSTKCRKCGYKALRAKHKEAKK